MAPLFSVILPAYNRAAMLRSALKSILAQTFTDYECFVLDDGSTDSTPAVFEEFHGQPRLRLFRFTDNRRQHVRRNFALRQASGTFAAFLDSDDLWLPGRLEAFAEAIRLRPETDFWFSNAYLLRYGRIVGTVFDPEQAIEEGSVPGWHAVGGRYLPYLTSNIAVRRAAFEQVGFYREDMKILEDTELYARMFKAGLKAGVLRRPLAVRRLHPEQITHDYRVDFEEAVLALKAGGIPPELLPVERERLALEVAGYLWRGLQPEAARQFLVEELGDKAKESPLYRKTFIPSWLLSLAKDARKKCLLARYHPLLAPAEFQQVLRDISPLLSEESVSSH